MTGTRVLVQNWPLFKKGIFGDRQLFLSHTRRHVGLNNVIVTEVSR